MGTEGRNKKTKKRPGKRERAGGRNAPRVPFFRSAELSNCLWQLEKARGYQGTAATNARLLLLLLPPPSPPLPFFFFFFLLSLMTSVAADPLVDTSRTADHFRAFVRKHPTFIPDFALASILPARARVFIRKNRSLFSSLFSSPSRACLLLQAGENPWSFTVTHRRWTSHAEIWLSRSGCAWRVIRLSSVSRNSLSSRLWIPRVSVDQGRRDRIFHYR